MSSVRLTVLAVALALAVGVCGGGGSSAEPRPSKQWTSYNEKRTGYDAPANAVAKSVVDRIIAAGFDCRDYGDYNFAVIANPYRLQDMPLALGAGSCNIGDENILVEVFGTAHPNAADFVAAKRASICKRAKDLGRLPDGSSDFDGIPYIMAADKTWIVEPDTFKQTKASRPSSIGLPATCAPGSNSGPRCPRKRTDPCP